MPLVIVANLSTEQAVAIFEMIDDMRQQIFHHYAAQIYEYYRRNRVTDRRLKDADQDDERF